METALLDVDYVMILQLSLFLRQFGACRPNAQDEISEEHPLCS